MVRCGVVWCAGDDVLLVRDEAAPVPDPGVRGGRRLRHAAARGPSARRHGAPLLRRGRARRRVPALLRHRAPRPQARQVSPFFATLLVIPLFLPSPPLN
jgi:hypothetical protein